jgi:hypothetical protein
VTSPLAHSRLLLLAAVGVTSLGLAGPAAAVTATDDAGLVRLTHLSPDTALVDVELSPFSSAETIKFSDLSYGEISDYNSLPAGSYTLSVRPDDEPQAPPMVTTRVEVKDGAALTLALTGTADSIQARALTDDLTPPPPGQARVRLLQGAGTAPTIDVTAVDGPQIASDVAFGTATGYANVAAGSWTLQITPTGGTAQPVTTDVVLAPGSVQTVLALQDGERLEARVVVDGQSMERMPSGGVQAGAGPATDEPVMAGLAVLAGLVGLGVTTALLRRPRPATSASNRRDATL